jgi:hypothetical protein
MFDKAPEIINLLNIMRGNDGRGELNVADFFDQDGELTNVEGLADACRGYISYVRGGDPATFPHSYLRLLAQVSLHPDGLNWV